MITMEFTANDLSTYTDQFQKNNFIVIDNFMQPNYVHEHFIPEVERCLPLMNRVNVPRFKKSGSVSRHQLKQHAPELFNLYYSDAMKKFVENVVGEKLFTSPEEDPHAVALYCYTEPGDHIGVHYDKSFYRGRRYTVLFGLIQNSAASQLICYPGASKLNRKKNPLDVYTHPGTLVIFDGDALWHEVTSLGENEKRVILTMEYVTDPRISWGNQLVSNFKDRLLYFG